MNVYKQAANALRDAMKVALDSDDIDPTTLSELWRHFLGVQSIAEKMKDVPPKISYQFSLNDSGSISINTSSLHDPDYNVNCWGGQAADTISFDTYGKDVITFS